MVIRRGVMEYDHGIVQLYYVFYAFHLGSWV